MLARRTAAGLVVVLVVFLLAEGELSNGGRLQRAAPIPGLWQDTGHAELPEEVRDGAATATFPSPALNCAMVTSMDPSSPFAFSSADAGVRFDIDADGTPDQVAWTEPGSNVAFLALDRDGDGQINDGHELIGGHTLPGATSGPRALTALSKGARTGQPDAVIDADDPLFARLLLWTDANHNGISEPSELRPAGSVLAAIGLGYRRQHLKDRHGNESRHGGFVHIRTEPGPNKVTTREDDLARWRPLYDVCLVGY